MGPDKVGVLLLASWCALGLVACGSNDPPAEELGSERSRGDDDDGGDDDVPGSDDGDISPGTSSLGQFLPSELPETRAECAAAQGSDGCIFDLCCDELRTCGTNPACAETFDCFANCGAEDSNCFVNCAGPSLEDGADDFSVALECALVASFECAGVPSPGVSLPDAGSEPNEVPTEPVTDELGYDLSVSDDPIVAEVELETDNSVWEEVTRKGAVLSARADDGTVYELTIPEGAVYDDTLITMTPIRSIAASPLEGRAFGVSLEPDGLELLAHATLEATPSSGDDWPLEEQLPLSITGEQSVVSLALLNPESEAVEMPLVHFSSYVVLLAERGTDATLSQADIRSRFGGDEAERLQSAAAERLGRARQANLLGVEDGLDDLFFEDLIAEFERTVLRTRIELASSSCAAAKLAWTTVLGVERQKQLLGLAAESTDQTYALFPTLVEVCMREEYEICRDEHIITRVIPRYLGMVRTATLLGLETSVGGMSLPHTSLLQAEEYLRKCLNFELQFDADVDHQDDGNRLSMRERVEARVPIQYQISEATIGLENLPPGARDSAALIIGPTTPLVARGYRVTTSQPCRTIDSTETLGGELLVAFMGFVPGNNTPTTPGGNLRVTDVGLSLGLNPNLSQYDYTERFHNEDTGGCEDPAVSHTEVLSWSTTLGAYFMQNIATAANGAWVDDWAVENGDILATKEFTLNELDSELSRTGTVRMVLFHTPQ